MKIIRGENEEIKELKYRVEIYKTQIKKYK